MDTILLVEDNEQIMEINEWYLTRHGYKTEKAYTVAQAREYLRKASPDLIILDVLLPDGDGLSFCTEIRRTHSMLNVNREISRLRARTGLSDRPGPSAVCCFWI